MSRLPKHNRHRPDFLAPGLQVSVSKGVSIENLDEISWSASKTGYSYYESRKTLGYLFRSIDEQEFFQELQNTSRQFQQATSGSLLNRVWLQVRRDAPMVDWKPYITWARHVKKS